jgi:acetylglutamate kinase
VTMDVRVVKVGGNLAEDAAWIASVAASVAAAGAPTVLVHGGGREVTRVQRALGIEPAWRDGLRITCPAGLEVVRMVLSGTMNKRWVAALTDAGAKAVGISGEDGRLLTARLDAGDALGRAGFVEHVRPGLLHALLAFGAVPVVSPVARGVDGGGVNVNADDAAADVAAALGAAELLFVSDVEGVSHGTTVLPALDADDADALGTSGAASGGMLPKLRAALRAREAGVASVRIGSVAMLTDAESGTRIAEAAHAHG